MRTTKQGFNLIREKYIIFDELRSPRMKENANLQRNAEMKIASDFSKGKNLFVQWMRKRQNERMQ